MSSHSRSQPPSIGILGGVGAIASARFHLALVEEWARVRGAQTDADFPEILHYSRDMHLGATGVTDPLLTRHVIDLMLHELRDCGRIAVLCNSITPYLPKWDRLLTPVMACVAALKDVKTAWLLASESTIRDGIYQRAYPHVEWKPLSIVKQIQQCISGGGVSSPFERIDTEGLPIVLGCTELSTRRFHWSVNTISPTDEMIRILCAKSLPYEPSPLFCARTPIARAAS